MLIHGVVRSGLADHFFPSALQHAEGIRIRGTFSSAEDPVQLVLRVCAGCLRAKGTGADVSAGCARSRVRYGACDWL